jgi:hypothetical protein
MPIHPLLPILMNPNRSILMVLTLGLLTATGCSTDRGPSGPKENGVTRIATNALDVAPQLVSQAVSGKRDRGEQDEMLRVEAKIPGFGGFYIDSVGNVVAYLKQSRTATPAGLVRSILSREYAGRSEQNVREIMSKASEAQIREGAYSLSELIAVENRIASSPASIPGLVGVGTSIFHNRVVAGFRDSSSMLAGLAGLSRRGIPTGAVVGEVWGEPRMLSDWNSIVRPTRGGIQLGVMNRTRFPWDPGVSYSGNGSLGFNVRTPAGVEYLMTASHVVNTWSGTNGALNDTVVQPWVGTTNNVPYSIGIITVNPPWTEGAQCPVRDSTTMTHFDYCTTADAALGTYTNALPERKIGTSDYEGLNGQPGCCNGHIHGWYPITGVLSPEFVKQQQTLGVHKSGSKTGTTTGTIGLPLTEIFVLTCWQIPRLPQDPNGPCVSNKYVLNQRVAQVLHIGVGGGDSGGAVFSGNGLPYNALGISTVAGPHFNSNGVCDVGASCYLFFARWDEIQLRTGLTLNPATVQ